MPIVVEGSYDSFEDAVRAADRANERSAGGPFTSTDMSDDAKMIDDLKSSETDLSGNRSNEDVGLSSDLNTSTDDTAGDSELDRSI